MPRQRSGNRTTRWLIATALLCAAAPLTARAAAPPTLDVATQTKKLQLEVFLEGDKTGLIAAFEQLSDGRMSARRSELLDIGLQPPGDGGPDTMVALESMPGLSYRYDEQKQAIYIQAPQSLRAAREYSAKGSARDDLGLRSGFGALLNYDVYTSTMASLPKPQFSYQGASAHLDARVFSPYGALSQSGIVGSTISNSRQLLRLDTTYSYSDPQSLITYNAGDTISSGLAWTRPIRLAGAQIQRNFGLRPDLVTLPLPVIAGNAAVPSTLDVYVNNIRAYSQEVTTGPYRVTDLPLTGDGTAHVVIHDSTGKQIEQDLNFFSTRLLLRPGLSDYSVEVGLPRRSYGTLSDDYAKSPAASASLRRGLYDWLTLETHAEGSQKLANGGVGVVARVLDRGVLSGAVAGSYTARGAGAQIYGSFETQYHGIALNVATQRTIGTYDDLASITAISTPPLNGLSVSGTAGLAPFQFLTSTRPPKEMDRLSIGLPIPFDKSTISGAVTRIVNADSTRALIASATWSRNIFFDASVYVSAYTNICAHQQMGIFAGVTVPIGDKVVASAGVTGGSQKIASADVSKPLELDEGSYGWRVHDSEGTQANAQRSASASYRSRWARVEVGAAQQGHSGMGSLEAEGSIATVGNGVYLANRIDDAFAVVDAGAPDVSVYHENRLIGHTDSSGRLLVPYLRSYQRNNLRIDTNNLPVNADASMTQDIVVPAYRNGVRVDFGVQTSVPGAVVIFKGADGKYLKPGLAGSIEGSKETFVVGYDGRAYIKGLGPSNNVRIALGVSECHTSFDYNPSEKNQVVVGPVVCQ